MRHLKPYRIFESEDKSFGERDMTNLQFEEGEWIRYSDERYADRYIEIEEKLGVDYNDIGFILMDFVEKYDLLYDCSYNSSRSEINIDFFPNSMYADKKDYKEWIYDHTGSKVPYYINYEQQIWEWDKDILDEMESRLNEHGLTTKGGSNEVKTMLFINTTTIEIIISKL